MKKSNILLLIVLLTIGFAAVSTTLILNGVVNIAENTKDFDVYFSYVIENDEQAKRLIRDDKHIAFTVDMSSVGEKYKLEYDVTNGSRNYDAAITINHTESNEYVKVTNEFDTVNNLLATQTRRGTLTIEVIKPYVGDDENSTKIIEVTCDLIANAVEREELATGTPAAKVKGPWEITEDNDGDGVLSIGDLITLATENFYVYDVDEDIVKVITQYNLYVGGIHDDYDHNNVTPIENPTGLQDSRAVASKWDGKTATSYPWIGVVPYTTYDKYFSEKDKATDTDLKKNDYSISVIKEQVDAYAKKLEELGGRFEDVRLITNEELVAVGCDMKKYSCKKGYVLNTASGNYYADETFEGAPEFIHSTSYWTSSPVSSENSLQVWGVDSGGLYSYKHVTDYTTTLGVRPVIEISKSLFE